MNEMMSIEQVEQGPPGGGGNWCKRSGIRFRVNANVENTSQIVYSSQGLALDLGIICQSIRYSKRVDCVDKTYPKRFVETLYKLTAPQSQYQKVVVELSTTSHPRVPKPMSHPKPDMGFTRPQLGHEDKYTIGNLKSAVSSFV